MSGAESFNGGATVAAGTLEFGSGATFTGTGTFTVNNGATLAFAPSTAFTFANTITGAGNLSVTGSAPLILTGTDNYTGTTSIATGATLQIGSAGTSGTIASTSGVSIAAGGTLSFVNPSTSFYEPISGQGSVTIDLAPGSSFLLDGPASSYSGGTNLEGGTLQVYGPPNLGTGTINFTNNATLQMQSGSVFTQGATLGTGGGTIDTNGFTMYWSRPDHGHGRPDIE